MLFVICRDGVPVKSFSEPIRTWDLAYLRLKQLYIEEQTQEIYVLPNRHTAPWSKAVFTFKPYGGGMHPKSVVTRVLKSDEVPKQVQIQHLMGAL